MRRDLQQQPPESNLDDVVTQACAAIADPFQSLRLLTEQAQACVHTGDRFRWLSAVTGQDTVLGKLFESHFDALLITRELMGEAAAHRLRVEVAGADGLWGVWAAEGPGSGVRLEMRGGQVVVSGRKSWCSGAGRVAAAMMTVRNAAGDSQLVAAPLDHPGVRVTTEGWQAFGMARTGSFDVMFDAVPVVPVGAPGQYVNRPGFWHGAAGVAACWHGASRAIAAPLRQRVRRAGDQADSLLAAHLGAVDCALSASASVLRQAATDIENHRAGGRAFGRREALCVRGTVEAAAQAVIDHVGRALGAGPLCRDALHARRVADLGVFLRQSHAEWDLAAQGRLAASGDDESDPWSL